MQGMLYMYLQRKAILGVLVNLPWSGTSFLGVGLLIILWLKNSFIPERRQPVMLSDLLMNRIWNLPVVFIRR